MSSLFTHKDWEDWCKLSILARTQISGSQYNLSSSGWGTRSLCLQWLRWRLWSFYACAVGLEVRGWGVLCSVCAFNECVICHQDWERPRPSHWLKATLDNSLSGIFEHIMTWLFIYMKQGRAGTQSFYANAYLYNPENRESIVRKRGLVKQHGSRQETKNFFQARAPCISPRAVERPLGRSPCN